MPTALPRYMPKPRLGARLNGGHPRARELVARWLMNEGGGNRVYDIVGSNHGVLTGPPDWAAGENGPMLSFDGSSDYITAVSDAPFALSNFTIFTKFRAPSGGSNYYTIANRESVSTDCNWWLVVWTDGTLRGRCSCVGDDVNEVKYSTSVQDDTWHTVALVGVSSSYLKLYVDGRYIDEENLIGDINTPSCSNWVGAETGTRRYFLGDIDGISYFRRELAPTEIWWLHLQAYADIQPLPVRIWADAPVAGVDFPELLPIMGVG